MRYNFLCFDTENNTLGTNKDHPLIVLIIMFACWTDDDLEIVHVSEKWKEPQAKDFLQRCVLLSKTIMTLICQVASSWNDSTRWKLLQYVCIC